jgi:hypothetical protein
VELATVRSLTYRSSMLPKSSERCNASLCGPDEVRDCRLSPRPRPPCEAPFALPMQFPTYLGLPLYQPCWLVCVSWWQMTGIEFISYFSDGPPWDTAGVA